MPEENKSAVLDDIKPEQEVPTPNFNEQQIQYLSALQGRLILSQTTRDTAHDEFDGMDYTSRYEDEERLANSFIPPKKNKSDTNFITGTIRQKMLALLSAVNALNLEPDDVAFDKDDVEISELGNVINVVRAKANEVDDDEEKKVIRQMELLKHGTVFVEDIWKVEWRKEKELNKKFEGSTDGLTWTNKLKKVYENPCRTVLDGRSVYLGDIRQPFINKQPYIFTVDEISFADAQSIYGKWDMFKYVNKKVKNFAGAVLNQSGQAYSSWRLLTATAEDRVEVIKYQDRFNNEFQILLNGIPMLPIGFPMPWKHAEYNIVQQNLEHIHPHFAYGRSFVSRLKVTSALLDEILRLAILKVQKSFMPPRVNNTGRVVSKNVFMPGSITMGLNANQLEVLSEKDGEGLLRGEQEMIKQLTENIDQNSVNPTFAGQQTQGNPTATEILELQRQAKMVLGLTVFSMAMLEKKLGILRRDILLENWFNPIDTKFDEVRKTLVNRYRTANVQKNIDGKGMGNMMVVPTDNKQMFPMDQMGKEMMSEQIYNEEESYSTPTRKLYVDAEQLTIAKITWKTVVNPTEAGGSERSKLLFERMATAANNLGIAMDPNELVQRFAETWQESPKLFQNPMPPAGVVGAGMGMPQGGGMPPMPPKQQMGQPKKSPMQPNMGM